MGNPRPVAAHAGRAPDRRADDGGGQARALHASTPARAPGERRRVRARPRCPTGTRTGSTRRSRSRSTAGTAREEPRLVLRAAAAPGARRRSRGPARSPGGGRSADGARASSTPPLGAGAAAGPAAPPATSATAAARGSRPRSTALVATGEPVLVVVACAERRARGLAGPGRRVRALLVGRAGARPRRLPMMSRACGRPRSPGAAGARARAAARRAGRTTHLAWGAPELRFTEDVLEHDAASRPALMALYAGAARGAGSTARGRAARRRPPRTAVARRPAPARPRRARARGRSTARTGAWRVPPAERTDLERSAAFRADAARLQEGRAWLSRASSRAA